MDYDTPCSLVTTTSSLGEPQKRPYVGISGNRNNIFAAAAASRPKPNKCNGMRLGVVAATTKKQARLGAGMRAEESFPRTRRIFGSPEQIRRRSRERRRPPASCHLPLLSLWPSQPRAQLSSLGPGTDFAGGQAFGAEDLPWLLGFKACRGFRV